MNTEHVQNAVQIVVLLPRRRKPGPAWVYSAWETDVSGGEGESSSL